MFDFDVSADGQWLVAGASGGLDPAEKTIAELLNLTRGGKPIRLDQEDTVSSVRFSPDGKLFAMTDGNRVVFRRLPDGAIDGPSLPLSTRSRRVAFSTDSRLLATVSMDHELRVWDVHSRRELHRFESEGWRSLSFGPENRYLLTVGPNQTPRIFWLTLPDLERETCRRISRSLTPEEWTTHFGSTSYRCTCPSVPLWKTCQEPGDS